MPLFINNSIIETQDIRHDCEELRMVNYIANTDENSIIITKQELLDNISKLNMCLLKVKKEYIICAKCIHNISNLLVSKDYTRYSDQLIKNKLCPKIIIDDITIVEKKRGRKQEKTIQIQMNTDRYLKQVIAHYPNAYIDIGQKLIQHYHLKNAQVVDIF